jgi:hypothetical protein
VLKFYPAQSARRAALTQLIQPGPGFRHLFEVFEHTAFGLEVRDRYDASYENESMRRFLAGEQNDLPWMQSWLVMLGDLTAQGRRFDEGPRVSRTAAIPGAATTLAACSAPPATAAASRSPGSRPGSPSSTPPRGRASRSRPGHPPRPATPSTPARGAEGLRPIPEDIPIACWLPVKQGLNPHGMRHGHKTWMAEDGIPEILAEHRLGHEVPGMRGLYAHTSDRMPEDLKAALQARWEDSLLERARPPRALTGPAARRTPRALSRASARAGDTARHPA